MHTIHGDTEWPEKEGQALLQIDIRSNTTGTHATFPYLMQIRALAPAAIHTSGKKLANLYQRALKRCCRVHAEAESNTLITKQSDSTTSIFVKLSGIEKVLQFFDGQLVTVPQADIERIIKQLTPRQPKRKERHETGAAAAAATTGPKTLKISAIPGGATAAGRSDQGTRAATAAKTDPQAIAAK
jgi:hypothetical protein